MRTTLLSLITILCLMLAVTPAMAGTVYTNGPIGFDRGAWLINGSGVSDSFTVGGGPNGTGYSIEDLHIGVWLLQGDHLATTDVGFGTMPFQTFTNFVDLGPTHSTDLGFNLFGYEIWQIDFTDLGEVPLAPGTYWLTLRSASVGLGNPDPVYWDENGGPSTAYAGSPPGMIPSESFTITGTANTPEPSSIALFGSGILGLAGVLRRRPMG